MTRIELDNFIQKEYQISPEQLFAKHPSFSVYRHPLGRKWFAVFMEVPRHRLGGSSEESVFVVNLKAEPMLIDLLRGEKGYYPAYHMNKLNWISVVPGEICDTDPLKSLIAMSFRLTMTKKDFAS